MPQKGLYCSWKTSHPSSLINIHLLCQSILMYLLSIWIDSSPFPGTFIIRGLAETIRLPFKGWRLYESAFEAIFGCYLSSIGVPIMINDQNHDNWPKYRFSTMSMILRPMVSRKIAISSHHERGRHCLVFVQVLVPKMSSGIFHGEKLQSQEEEMDRRVKRGKKQVWGSMQNHAISMKK